MTAWNDEGGPGYPNEASNACAQCGMTCEPNEYHPYAACLMYSACHDSATVRANLDAVRHSLLDRRATDKGEHFVESTIDLDFEEPRSAAPDGESVFVQHANCGFYDGSPAMPTVSDASSATTPNVNEISSSLVVGGATPDGIYAGVDVCPLNEWLDFHNRGQVTKDDRYLRIADVPRLLKNAVSSATREAENAWDRRELGASMEHAHPAQQQRPPGSER